MAKVTSDLNKIVDNFETAISKPESFLSQNETLLKSIKANLKSAYDLTKNKEKKQKSNALPELIVENFDIEQIWQQIELQNDAFLTRSLINVSKLVVNKDKLSFKVSKEESSSEEEAEEEIVEENAEIEQENNEEKSSEDELSLGDEDLSDEEEEKEVKDAPQTKYKPSIVDDQFFKLGEMENFLQAIESKTDDPDSGNDSENSDSEESVDLFDENEDEAEHDDKIARFKDFFAEPKDGAANRTQNPESKRNKFLQDLESDEDSTEEKQREFRSTMEKRQERLEKKIAEIETNAIGEKPWQLKGEITAENRPQNSLLEQVVEFDLTSRPAPVITEQTTMQLEDIIRQRIKDKAFDSVQRKAKLIETPLEYKKKLVLEQEKSKQSLAQIYEKEFLEKQAALNPDDVQDKAEEEPELHKEIKKMMHSLFSKLDALSNFHFTPKPAMPELKIVSNLPAISMEEVAPVAASDAALLAPEEVQNKAKGELLGKAERTSTDKNRERRKKKLKQRAHLAEKEKKEKNLNKLRPGLGNKFSKENAEKLLEKVTKDRNVDKMDESSAKSVKSSKAFFTQLQEEVDNHISGKTQKKSKGKNKAVLDAKKMKL